MTLAAPSAAPTDPTRAEPVPVAVVGAGRTGLAVAAMLATHTRARLAGFVEPRRDVRGFAREAGFRAPAEARADRLAARAPFPVAIVCAPAGVREVQVLEALATGASVLALAPCDPGAAPGARLRVGAPLLFHPLYEKAVAELQSGAIGAIRRLHLSAFASRVFGPRRRPARGDVLDHLGATPLRLLDALAPTAHVVRCELHGVYGGDGDELHATFAASGLEASLDASWSVPDYPRRAVVLEAEGERGRLLLAADALELETSRAGERNTAMLRWTLADLPHASAFAAGEPGLMAMVEAFLGEWPGAVTPRFDPAAARRTQERLEAMRIAAA